MSKNNYNDNSQTDSRSDKLKLFSIGSVVLLAAIIILGNFLFDKILGGPLTFDFSDYSQNTVSDVTTEYLNSLSPDTHIRIVGLFSRPENISGTSYQYIIPLLDDYARKSGGKVTVEYINPTEQPTIIASLDPSSSYDLASNEGNYVVEYNGKLKIITPLDCYSYDESYYYTSGYYVVTGNNTEFTFTNAMHSMTSGSSSKAYIITGLKEEGNVNLKKIVEAMAIDVEEITVSDNFTVPEDCRLIILNGPNTDIPEKVYVALADYVNRGGKLFVAVDYSSLNVNEKYDRLNRLLNQMNINIDPLLISENDPGYQRSGYSVDTVVVSVGQFESYTSIPYLHSTYARSVRLADTTADSVTALPVLNTSDNAITVEIDENGQAKENGVEIVGCYNVAMYAKSDKTGAEAFVFGTLDFSSDAYISQYSLNDSNVEFFRSCIRELIDEQTGSQLMIETKTVDNFSIDPNKSTATSSMLVLIIFMIVIPVILIAMAVVVYAKRKNL